MALRKLASLKLKWFTRYTFPEFVHENYHEELFNALESVARGEMKKLIVMLPPRSGKSEIISKRFPAWMLGRFPKKRIVVSSYGATLADSFGRKARGIVLSDEYKRVFPNFELADDKKESSNWETAEGGGYYAVGVGGALTGVGFDCGIIDDPVKDREEAESLTIREKVWDWYTSTFLTRKQGSDAAIIILMTRWNTDDLAGRILEAEAAGWNVIKFPAIDEKGVALCNRLGFGLSFYEEQRRTIGVRDFEALYQQDPVRSMGQIFKKEDFRYFALSDLKPEDFTIGIHVDPAFSTRESSDDTGIIVTARHKVTKELYILDCLAQPLLPSEAWAYVISAATKWKGWSDLNFISCEEATISKDQQEFIKGLEKAMREQNKFFTLVTFNPRGKGKKEDRIKFSLEPMFNRKAIYFRSDDSGNDCWQKLETQLLKFPTSRKDDIMDALSQGVIMWENHGADSFGTEQEEIAALEDLLSFDAENSPRNNSFLT